MQPIELITWGELPAVRLHQADGAQATLTLYGAHLVSWQSADGVEQLFCSAQSARDGSKAIRGGVPIIFPQFAARGQGLRHGFARLSHWRIGQQAASNDASCWLQMVLEASDISAAHAAQWPHAFRLEFRVDLTANDLTMQLRIHNCGNTAFNFSTALHSYWKLDQLVACQIAGLEHQAYSDHLSDDAPAGQDEHPLTDLNDKIDRIYRGVKLGAGQGLQPLQLQEGARCLQMTQQGFHDVVVWNPGAADTATLNDLDNSEYQHFICIEAANVDIQTLAPGSSLEASQTIRTLKLTSL